MSPILSRLALTRDGAELNPRILHSLINLHASPPEGGRILWCQPRRDLLLIQSAGPVLAAALPGVASAAASAPVCVDWDLGQRVEVATICNPATSHGPRSNGKQARVPKRARPSDEWAAWLTEPYWSGRFSESGERVMEPARLGVAPTEVRTEALRTLHVRKPERTVSLSRVGFHVAGTVADPGRLRQAILRGLGDGRAYGLGLLLVSEAAR